VTPRYDRSFYETLSEQSRPSAGVVVPLLVHLVAPRSVIDLGCGTGEWLAAFTTEGIHDVVGVDAGDVPSELVRIAPERMMRAELTKPLDLGRTFDLALSLEVGEHLPESSAPTLVDSLVRHAPVVAFSAAVPDQRGTNHVNEQWQDWWAELFAQRGYLAVDAIRRRIWNEEGVQFWYAQNLLLYVERDELSRRPLLRTEHELMGTQQLALVHPARMSLRRDDPLSLRIARRARRLLHHDG
jgi:SAM-dependent methyltransferase